MRACRIMRVGAGVVPALAMACAVARAGDPAAATNAAPRVAVYDSRAVAVAFVGSKAFISWMERMRAEMDRARAAGDQKRVEEIAAQMRSQQEVFHRQAFGTAPVNNLLVHLKDSIPAVMRDAGAVQLISKWDEQAMAPYAAAERVDVTMALVDAMRPTERQRRLAAEIRERKPLSASELDRMPADR